MLALVTAAVIAMEVAKANPPIEEVHRAAIKYSNLDLDKPRKWNKDARMQALLPRLQVEYERHIANNINVDVSDTVYVGSNGVTVGPGENSYARDYAGNQNVVVKAIWMLNELIFTSDQLDISAESRAIGRERQILLSEVNKHYYNRLELIKDIGDLKSEKVGVSEKKEHERKIFQKQVNLGEETASLDALTGGWFGRELGE